MTLNSIQSLAISEYVQLHETAMGFPFLEINNTAAHALISVYGAHVLAFKPHASKHDVIYTSPDALYQSGKAIRGGIPVCFPWFGNDPTDTGRPAHGFARTQLWTLTAVTTLAEDCTQVVLTCSATPETRQYWAGEFETTLSLTIGNTLHCALTTRNTGNSAFSITQALHTYFCVGDSRLITIEGLDKVPYLDKTQHGTTHTQHGAVTFQAELDRIYQPAPATVVLQDPQWQRQIYIQAQNSDSIVIWNPWQSGAKRLADLPDEDYLKFVCVETANVLNDSVWLAPAQTHTVSVEYRVSASLC